MSQNNLFEIGSKANVILRFRTETCVNGKTYSANEPYILFKNANVLIDYSNEDKTGTAARTVIANSQINPRTVSVGSVNLTRKLIALLTSFNGTEESFGLTRFETKSPEEENGDKFMMLDNNILTGSEDNIFVYEEESFDAIDFTYHAAQNRVISSDFDLSKNYLISYSSVKAGMKYKLEKNHVPYFSLEIQGVGNVDKITKNVVMFFDKVSLNTTIDFSFIQDQMINVPLIFHIIENKNNYIWVEE